MIETPVDTLPRITLKPREERRLLNGHLWVFSNEIARIDGDALRTCIGALSQILAEIPGANGRPAQRMAAELEARLRFTGIEEVLEEGLQAWIHDYILLVRQLGSAVHSAYLEAV